MIVLDTHTLLWWVNGDSRISQPALDAIEFEMKADNGVIMISAMSAWEIALLVERGRLTLTMSTDDLLNAVAEIEGVRFMSLDVATAVESTRLPGEFHKDPADRMIVALARHFNSDLITADDKIIAYKHVRTVW